MFGNLAFSNGLMILRAASVNKTDESMSKASNSNNKAIS